MTWLISQHQFDDSDVNVLEWVNISMATASQIATSICHRLDYVDSSAPPAFTAFCTNSGHRFPLEIIHILGYRVRDFCTKSMQIEIHWH